MAVDAELVFIPVPVMGHLPPTVEMARKLVAQSHHRISVTILIMKFPSTDNQIKSFIQSLKPSNSTSQLGHGNGCCIRSLELPEPRNTPDLTSKCFLQLYTEAYKPLIKQTLLEQQHHRKLAGLVLDMCCTAMIEVANELGVPSYILFNSGAPFLRLMLHFGYSGVPDVTPTTGQLIASPGDETWPVLEVAGFRNPVPAKVWPDIFLDKDNGCVEMVLEIARRIQETKGILLNSFAELESDLIRSLTSQDEHNGAVIPSVYPVGPILNLKNDFVIDSDQKNQIMSWLDLQPPCSVVFLCFGSRGIFEENQMKEMVVGLERSGYRFLWSLKRKPTRSHSGNSNGWLWSPEEYEDFKEVLSEGFLSRTAGIGRVTGWVPQASVLEHKAIGAFVSHCGWNSILESLWFGVPLVTWPMYAEQQLNAFVLVNELRLAMEIRMDYKCNFQGEANVVVGAEVIEKTIKRVMEEEEEEGRRLREKTRQISEMAQKGLEIGGSSYKSMGRFIEDVFRNLS